MSCLKLVYCIRRNPSLTREEFQSHWLNIHAKLVKDAASLLGASRYVQSHTVTSPLADDVRALRGSVVDAFDGIAEFWIDGDFDEVKAKINESEDVSARVALFEDEKLFIDLANSVIFMTEEHEIYNFSKK